jgi:Ca2+-binding RTX toxin-like protein
MAEPTAYEQLFLELINRARLDPAAEAARTGVSLGTIPATQKQPLAFNPRLNDAADSHSSWMLANGVFSHTGAGGSSPGARMQAAGYSFTGSWTWGENIAWNGTTGTLNVLNSVLSQHDGLFRSSGHRANILNDNFKEAGIGSIVGKFKGYNALMTTQDFAKSGTGSFVTGVAYNDTNNDAFYSIGEGKGGIQMQLLSGTSVLGTTATWSAGGYSLKTTAVGQLTVKFSGGGLTQSVGATITMGSPNAKVDLVNGNTIQSSVSAALLDGTANLTLLGINALNGTGNSGNNILTGNKGANQLNGADGSDTLRGGAGNDLLNGGLGNDTMAGNTGNDTFVFSGLHGNDRISDFEDGLDKIRFLGAAGESIADLTITGNGTSQVTVVHDDGTIVVAGASPITLTAADFEFLA